MKVYIFEFCGCFNFMIMFECIERIEECVLNKSFNFIIIVVVKNYFLVYLYFVLSCIWNEDEYYGFENSIF